MGAAHAPPGTTRCARRRGRVIVAMIVLAHVATGAAAGVATGSRARALAIGPVLHLACDLVPHEHFASRVFEVTSGMAAVSLLARRRGIDAATVGAVASTAPDLVHLLPQRRRQRTDSFTTARPAEPGQGRRVSASLQFALAVALLAYLCRRSHRDDDGRTHPTLEAARRGSYTASGRLSRSVLDRARSTAARR